MELQTIQNKIHEIRGQKVMLDFDLAEMYGIETRVLKQAVRRNPKRFEGNDFMFELTKEELSRSQFVTLNKGRGNNFKYMPFAFTELGVAMLSSVLTTCSVFLPLIFLSGTAGALFYDQAMAVTIALFASLLVAVLVLPVYFYLMFLTPFTRNAVHLH